MRRLLEETKNGAMPSVAVCFAGPSRRPAPRPPGVASVRISGSARPARPHPSLPPVPSLSIPGLHLSPPPGFGATLSDPRQYPSRHPGGSGTASLPVYPGRQAANKGGGAAWRGR